MSNYGDSSRCGEAMIAPVPLVASKQNPLSLNSATDGEKPCSEEDASPRGVRETRLAAAQAGAGFATTLNSAQAFADVSIDRRIACRQINGFFFERLRT